MLPRLAATAQFLKTSRSPCSIRASQYIRTSLDEGVTRGKVTAEQRDRAVAQLGSAHSVEEACREADIVIEAVPEEMEIKLEIFTLLDKFAKPGAIFASNTSSLSITEMADDYLSPRKMRGPALF